ncbi:1-acyl-sn-glycerol-3-phosphate acyltransferase 1, chloroplastic-like [Canna indica]|uniref:1-acyl-sn-glycerol-3-phosphate acyltransferase n=1 Tax=Canna indica TaxID=4628 RepID=A0AAQ3QCS7_9LILI|nr:1-acyl-sn-glycerol-3-phosphate acyltransferase 1, chloroplastic-like [Canna indica]
MMAGSFLWIKPRASFPSIAPLNRAPASRNALSSPVVVVSGYRNNQFGRGIRLRCPKPVIPIEKQPTVRRDTIARSDIAAAGPANDAGSVSEFQLVSRVRGICFYGVTAIAAIFLFAMMVVVHPSVALFDRYRRRAHHLIAKIWATVTITPFYTFKFEGMENLPHRDAPAVYVSNHQSFLDIYTLLTLGRSFKFISKRSIFLLPIIGWAMFLMGVIPIRRMDRMSQLDCLKRCMDFVKKGASVFFFPEGTRSKDGKLGAFKKGAFTVAAKTGVPVVPITLMGTGEIMPPGKEGIVNLGSVKVVVHKPLDGEDANKLCSEARDTIAKTLLLHGYGVQ